MTTNPEQADPQDRSDFVSIAFVLDQTGGTAPDDGKYRFNETLIGNNVNFTGVDGGLEVIMPLTADVFGTEIALATPLRIRTNPVYDTTTNAGLEQIFLHLFDLPGAGPQAPVIFETPNIDSILGGLTDSVIRTLLERLGEAIGDLKDLLLGTDLLDFEIPGTGRSLNSFFGARADDGLPDVTQLEGLGAILNLDTYLLDYLDEVQWLDTNTSIPGPVPSVQEGTLTASAIWSGLATFLGARLHADVAGL